jgi:multidrug resistance efflux pump
MVQPTATSPPERVARESGSDRPPPSPPRRGRLRKWRARLIVLLLIAAAVYLGYRVNQAKTGESARIDLGTVTLTSQVIPVETARTGQVISVNVAAAQKVSTGDRLGSIQVTTNDSNGKPVVSTVNLTAPRDGIVVDDPMPVGSTVQPGLPFVKLYDPAKFVFSGQVPLKNLPQIAPGMVATLQAEGLKGSVKAVVQRVVPRVDDSETDVKPDHMRVVLVPRNADDVAGLVPGLRFTGSVDTRTGQPGRGRLVRLGAA